MDDLYFHNDIREVFVAVASFPIVYNLSKKETYEKVLSDIKNGTAGNIQQDLYEAYSANLRKAVNGVFPSGDNADLFSANVSRFAAYKSYHATQKLKEQFEANPESFDKIGKAILNTYNRYQAAEYNTAIARCRTAKQFEGFMQEDNKFLFPNMRWLPSSSANPREEHRVFWNRVWTKDDPFWNANQPGNIWNCKCDWEETDNPATDGNPTGKVCAKGLDGNPAKTGEVFTDECAYIKNVSAENKAIIEDFIEYKILEENPSWNKAFDEINKYNVMVKDISKKDCASVWNYSKKGYTDLNQKLYLGVSLNTFDNTFIKSINNALDKLPKVPKNEILYRGCVLTNKILEKYSDGSIITEKAFVSTSLEKEQALNFIRNPKNENEKKVLFMIYGQTAANIDCLSHWNIVKKESENEYLFSCGRQFKVVERTTDNDIVLIIMKEL